MPRDMSKNEDDIDIPIKRRSADDADILKADSKRLSYRRDGMIKGRKYMKTKSNINMENMIAKVKEDNINKLMELLKKDSSTRQRFDVLNIAHYLELLKINVTDVLPKNIKDQLFKLLYGAVLEPKTLINISDNDLFMLIIRGKIKINFKDENSEIVRSNKIIHTHKGIFGNFYNDIKSVQIVGRENAIIGILTKEDAEAFALSIEKHSKRTSLRFSGFMRNSTLIGKESNTKVTDLDETFLIENLLWIETDKEFCIDFILSYNFYITNIDEVFTKVSKWVQESKDNNETTQSLIVLLFAWMYINPGDFNRYERLTESLENFIERLLDTNGQENKITSHQSLGHILDSMLHGIKSKSEVIRVELDKSSQISIVIIEEDIYHENERSQDKDGQINKLNFSSNVLEVLETKRIFITDVKRSSDSKYNSLKISQEIIAINYMHPSLLNNSLIEDLLIKPTEKYPTTIHIKDQLRTFHSLCQNQNLVKNKFDNCQSFIKHLNDLYKIVDSNIMKEDSEQQKDVDLSNNRSLNFSRSELSKTNSNQTPNMIPNSHEFLRNCFRLFLINFHSTLIYVDPQMSLLELKRSINRIATYWKFKNFKKSRLVRYFNDGKNIIQTNLNNLDMEKPFLPLFGSSYQKNILTEPLGLCIHDDDKNEQFKNYLIYLANFQNDNTDSNGCFVINMVNLKYLAAELTMKRFEQYRNSDICDIIIDDLDLKRNSVSKDFLEYKNNVDKEINWIKYMFTVDKNPSRLSKLFKKMVKLIKYLFIIGNLSSAMAIIMAIKSIMRTDGETLVKVKNSIKIFRKYCDLLNPKGNYSNYYAKLSEYDNLAVIPFYVVHSSEIKRASVFINDALDKENHTIDLSKIKFLYESIKKLIKYQQREFDYGQMIERLDKLDKTRHINIKDVQSLLKKNQENNRIRDMDIFVAHKFVEEEIDKMAKKFIKNYDSTESLNNNNNYLMMNDKYSSSSVNHQTNSSNTVIDLSDNTRLTVRIRKSK